MTLSSIILGPWKSYSILSIGRSKKKIFSRNNSRLGFWTGGSAAVLDLQSIKSYMTPLGMTIGQCNLSVAATASVGGFTYGLLGSKTYSNDILVSLFALFASTIYCGTPYIWLTFGFAITVVANNILSENETKIVKNVSRW